MNFKNMSINEIKNVLKGANLKDLRPLILSISDDERAGVVKLKNTFQSKLDKYDKIFSRYEGVVDFDNKIHSFVIGMDEVGRGPLFGPVLAAACNIEPSDDLYEVYDSKSLSEGKRAEIFDIILSKSNGYGIGVSSAKVIDEIGIQGAISFAMRDALKNCISSADTLSRSDYKIAVDYISFDLPGYDAIRFKKGDTKSFQIACASVIAKVTRDNIIKQMAIEYPAYDLTNNKGYGSKKHISAIKKYGPSSEHRMSFLKGIIEGEIR